MDGIDKDLPLFEGYDPPRVEPIEKLSAGRRLTRRQADDIAAGRHPLTLAYTLVLPLHADGDRTRTAASPQDGTPTCGTCVHRRTVDYRGKWYPKCTHDQAPLSHGPATDVRAWWPACVRFEPEGDR